MGNDYGSPFLEARLHNTCKNYVVCATPGVLQGIMIGNAGCCEFEIREGLVRDPDRVKFKMAPAFAGSFYLGIGFLYPLVIDISGEMPCHLFLSYRKAKVA